jgi:hypothetical protein
MYRSALRLSTAVVAVCALTALAGCTSSAKHPSASSSAKSSASASASKAVAAGELPSGVTQPPSVPTSVANVVALRKNVLISSCKATSTGWGAAGTVTNPAATAHNYVVTVFFTTIHATVIGFGSTTVMVQPGGKESWTVDSKFHAPSVTNCVLRGVG